LDEIDPNSIETVEVLKGPSAVALYGSDAANGVIVITSKRGRAGPARWNLSGSWGQTRMRGTYSNNYWMWGHAAGQPNVAIHCTNDMHLSGLQPCVQDSLVSYQILNDPNTTVLGHGNTYTYRAGVSGGTGPLTYALSASTSSILGLVKMPDQDVAALSESGVSIPGWQRRPDRAGQSAAQFNASADVTPETHVSVTSMINRTTQQNTPLSTSALANAQSMPPNGAAVVTNAPLFGTGLLQLIPDFRTKVSSTALRFSNAVNASVRPWSFFTGTATAGLDVINRDDRSILARGDCFDTPGTTNCSYSYGPTSPPLSAGFYNTGEGSSRTTTVTLLGTVPVALADWLTLQTSVGGNYVRTTTNDLVRNARDIPAGASSGNSASVTDTRTSGYDNITAGIFGEINIGLGHRLFLQPAIRRDAGSGLGASVSPLYPKMTVSYVLSDEPAFKRLPFADFFNTLRLRMAYGKSGLQPQATAKFRNYSPLIIDLTDDTAIPVTRLSLIGNPDLQPEKTREYEGGFDTDFLHNRLSLSMTWYQKRTENALVSQYLPSSLGSYAMEQNVGKIQNTGTEVSLSANLLETRSLSWSANVGLTSQHNRVLAYDGLNFDILSSYAGASGKTYNRIAVGYPLYGVWVRPILAYADINDDGFITNSEVSFGDSAVYAGAPYPRYEASFGSTLTFFTRLSISATMQYQSGLTQQNIPPQLGNLRSWNDSLTPLPIQAYQAAALQLTNNYNGSTIGFVQTVSVLRLNELSVSYDVPAQLTRRALNAHTMRISLQGTNLGVWSNYRGNDPNVNGRLADYTVDSSVLPTPRTWMLTARIN
jgi:TonB-dependent SusC/RagA subfamily outer membrane receptor